MFEIFMNYEFREKMCSILSGKVINSLALETNVGICELFSILPHNN